MPIHEKRVQILLNPTDVYATPRYFFLRPMPLDQRFSTSGPRTPCGPRRSSQGSAGKVRKTEDPSHFN